MKRLTFFCTMLMLISIVVGLCLTAIDPADFSGEWYSSKDQSVYQFHDGLIYCDKHAIMLSDTEYISGAYTYSRNSIFLFAVGIEGLETGRELFLVQSEDSSLLCEKKDGSGTVYFIRDHK